jgi:glycosyltransferase involved in cell wall biosynthesis
MFTIFGPLYRFSPSYKSIVGFAQPWIIYPKNECYPMLSMYMKIKFRLKFSIQAFFFKRADVIVVELQHVKDRLISQLGINSNCIHVVHNCISSVYMDARLWENIDIKKNKNFLCLGFLGRNYIHKNTAIFPEIAAILREKYNINVLFYVTFTQQEWYSSSQQFRSVCVNIGPISVAQCPNFYKAMDGVIFPSLLECFSASPLEAMFMKKPLFASDRAFNRDICGVHANYFDPISPDSAAVAIRSFFHSDIDVRVKELRAAHDHALSFSNPKDRAKKYMALLMDDKVIRK